MVDAQSMEYRNLGPSGLKVSVLSFGTMTQGWKEGLEEFSFQCVDKCIRAGVNTFDTAEFYGNGLAETVFGKNLV
jgi:aryl-alcohol dehydrogenase-like predicted oxidoreductase